VLRCDRAIVLLVCLEDVILIKFKVVMALVNTAQSFLVRVNLALGSLEHTRWRLVPSLHPCLPLQRLQRLVRESLRVLVHILSSFWSVLLLILSVDSVDVVVRIPHWILLVY
jgi:hypothetical protein